MRFMIIVKANKYSEAGLPPPTDEQFKELMAEMGRFHEELHKAGVLLDASGLKPSSHGWRMKYQGEKRSFTDGPFAETKELVAGYTIIQVKSREEALEWSRRYPNPAGKGGVSEIEVRQFYELDDFDAPEEEVERFRRLEKERR